MRKSIFCFMQIDYEKIYHYKKKSNCGAFIMEVTITLLKLYFLCSYLVVHFRNSIYIKISIISIVKLQFYSY